MLFLGVPVLVFTDQWTKLIAVHRLTFYGYRHLEPIAVAPYEVWSLRVPGAHRASCRDQVSCDNEN